MPNRDAPAPDALAIAERFRRVRTRTDALAAPLTAEDMVVQSMPDASPTKWHMAHTTWFFEEFVLGRFEPGHRWADERWRTLFNSYYEAAGPRHPRAARGLLSRPPVDAVRAWRAEVDARVLALLERAARAGDDSDAARSLCTVALLGTHHEEQHQELLLTDIQHALSGNPLRPAYAPAIPRSSSLATGPAAHALDWTTHDETITALGHGGDGFAFDNESPRHRALVGAFQLASRAVTNGEYARFVEDGGYARPELWLSDGWSAVKTERWSAPLYWERQREGKSDGDASAWQAFSLRGGLVPLDPHAPVSHVSSFEADAYARWAGARLPTEFEWESVAASRAVVGNFVESERLEPARDRGDGQFFGDVWEWTASAYLPYPRFRALPGALGEYNGKFMSGQMVLRGGSCFSPADHLRATYRNFFPPHVRWQMAGIRLARDL